MERAFEETPAADSPPPAAPAVDAASPTLAAPSEPELPLPLPAIEVPLPEPPAAVTNEDFAPAEPPPTKGPAKQAGSGT